MAKQQALEKDVNSFEDLRKEIIGAGLCGRCGGCASFCSADEMHALGFDRSEGPKLVAEDNCLKCGICYLICPQIKALDAEVREKFGWQPPIGIHSKMVSACTTEPKVSEVCTDGGVVTSLLRHALKKRLIQGALVSKRMGPFSRQPFLATDPDELIEAAGTHFDEVQHLGEFGKGYSTYSPTIQEIKKIDQLRLDKIALVGTPCQIYTVRKMQVLNIVPADSIAFTIGLFCMENFTFDSKAVAALEKKLGVKLGDIAKLNIKDDVILTTADGQVHHVPFDAVDEIARPACMACPDFANDFADISVGGLGSPDGYTSTVIRTSLGQKFYNGAKQDRVLKELRLPSKEKARLHRTELMAKITAFTRRKKARARATLARIKQAG
ncbi:MAG: Coenzyme F420 hydrogenase/dehydrogenase, beta subunit C-terminal domain [Planctomycetota bacterium]|jgi:coenzyme F420 hydrogenase subunit beta